MSKGQGQGKLASGSVIRPCTCVHEAQDDFYGKGLRVMNRHSPKSSVPQWRCTVCGKEQVGT